MPNSTADPVQHTVDPPVRLHRTALARAMRDVTYEVLPFNNTEDRVLAHVPKEVGLTVTTTETKGLGPTIDLACRLREHGYVAAPHLAARLVRDRAHLRGIVDQLGAADVASVFVIGGDAAEPAGDYPDALSLLEDLEVLGHSFDTVGIGGYPEGHGKISDGLLGEALRAKARHATHVITQLCFAAHATIAWARTVGLPVRAGIPGAVSRQKLIRISAGLGLGQSARFLAKQQSMFWRFFLPGGYSPNRLIKGLTPALTQEDNGLHGFHVFTFNDLESTEAWRQAWLRRLS